MIWRSTPFSTQSFNDQAAIAFQMTCAVASVYNGPFWLTTGINPDHRHNIQGLVEKAVRAPSGNKTSVTVAQKIAFSSDFANSFPLDDSNGLIVLMEMAWQ